MHGIKRMLYDNQNRRERDKKKFEKQDGDLCMLCHAYGSDKRSLFIDCFYDISEVVPEALDIQLVDVPDKKGWYLRICKHCRGELLGHLQEWRNAMAARRLTPKDHDGNDSWDDEEANIAVRINGTTVMMTIEQYEAWKGKQNER